MPKTEKKGLISPKEFSRLLAKIELRDVYLKEAKTTLFSRELVDGGVWTFDEAFRTTENEPDHATIEIKYLLKGKCKRRNIFTISCIYVAEFTAEEKIPESFFEIYNKYSLPLQTFPFFREFTNSVISRMGLPPLVMPLRKYLIDESK